MQNIMLMRLQELSKNCASFVRRSGLLFHFILAQSGIILAQFLYKSYTIFLLYFILLQWANRCKAWNQLPHDARSLTALMLLIMNWKPTRSQSFITHDFIPVSIVLFRLC